MTDDYQRGYADGYAAGARANFVPPNKLAVAKVCPACRISYYDALPSSADLDADAAERRIAEETK